MGGETFHAAFYEVEMWFCVAMRHGRFEMDRWMSWVGVSDVGRSAARELEDFGKT